MSVVVAFRSSVQQAISTNKRTGKASNKGQMCAACLTAQAAPCSHAPLPCRLSMRAAKRSSRSHRPWLRENGSSVASRRQGRLLAPGPHVDRLRQQVRRLEHRIVELWITTVWSQSMCIKLNSASVLTSFFMRGMFALSRPYLGFLKRACGTFSFLHARRGVPQPKRVF